MADWLTIGQSFPQSSSTNDKPKKKRDKKIVAKLAPADSVLDATLKELTHLKKMIAVKKENEALSKDF